MRIDSAKAKAVPAFVTSSQQKWHGFVVTLVYFLVVFIGGAALAPWIYYLIQNIALNFTPLSELSDEPFRRFVNRCLLGLGLIGLWPFLTQMRMHSWKSLGWGDSPTFRNFGLSEIGKGFLTGFATLAAFIAISVLCGGRDTAWMWSDWLWIRKLLSAILTALTVAVLEETLFRGGLFGGFSRFLKLRWALIFSSMIYSILHFFAKPDTPETVHWWSGWTTLLEMSRGFLDPERAIPGFLNLTLAGAFLCWVYYKKRILYWCVGIHAGWIFSLKLSRGVVVSKSSSWQWLWGDSQVTNGWGVSIAILMSWIALYLSWQRLKCSREPSSQTDLD